MTPSWAVQLTQQKDGMPFRRTCTNLRNGPVGTSWSSIKPSARSWTWKNPRHEHRQGNELTESSSEEKGLRVLVNESLDMSQQWVLIVQEDSPIVDYIKIGVASRVKEVILLYFAQMRAHLEYSIQVWGPEHKNGSCSGFWERPKR